MKIPFAPLGPVLVQFLFATATTQLCGRAAEVWADPNLPVRDSVELWLDASTERAARTRLQFPPIDASRGMDYWHDASGHQRHLGQRIEASRPRWRAQAGTAFVRFDGIDDFLSASPQAAFSNVTVVVFASVTTNAGRFRAFLSWNQAGRNDYQSGFNLDLGGGASTRWEALSVEGAGMSSQRNLLQTSAPFGAFQTVVVTSTPGNQGTKVRWNGVGQGSRDRKPGSLIMDELLVGAREYDTPSSAPAMGSPLAGDIAELLIYSRVLSEDELGRVERYLTNKHAGLLRGPEGGPVEKLLEPDPDAPLVQMLVPGFAVRELPLNLNNVNNLIYAPDGRLFALGYDGNVWQLRDSDNDGLEDEATLFWNNSGGEILATIGMAWGPGGLYIPNQGRILRLRDQGNGTSALEVVNSGWVAPTQVGGSTLDAVGIATDGEGNVYFGLGADKWSEPYIIDPQSGRSRYRLDSERGTIIRLSPDGQREVLATGLRWPVGLAVHPNGDLFCVDQEGATWLANGNPFDELLHIQKGRHYGFPPRHPKYLPNVIDEPSVFDYAPQHQSTCAIHFNVPAQPGGPSFGPAAWRGDALLTGESRGKLWRTHLVKTAAGYVAQNHLIARLRMLTIDSALSPQGDLVVTCHSGAPDWGTGPQGKGKLFKISYTDRDAPQPLFAYPASPTETRVVFDRPPTPEIFRAITQEGRLEAGRYVSAGDRFEIIRPGYQVVVDQMNTPRFEQPILSAGLGEEGKVLVLRTTAREQALGYALRLPWHRTGTAPAKAISQRETADLAFDLSGVETEWQSTDQTSGRSWTGWLPHLDFAVAKALVGDSSEHAAFFARTGPGRLTLRTQLDLGRMLRPAIQAGAKIDYAYEPEKVTVVFETDGEIQVKTPTQAAQGIRTTQIVTTPEADTWLPIEVTLKGAASSLAVHWFTADDPRPRALPLRRMLLPWAKPDQGRPSSTERAVPEVAGGHWLRGRRLFFGEQLGCARCHTMGGEGGHIGPDLSNLVQRDYASVLKDITQPSAAINPDHVAYHLDLKNGDSLTVLRLADQGERWLVADVKGQTNSIAKSEIAESRMATVSLMPEGLLQGLTETDVKDLLSFLLLAPPLEPAPLERAGEPPPRRRADFARLPRSEPSPSALRPLHLVLCAAPKDHGPGEHDYPLWQKRWSRLLSLADNVTTETADLWPTDEQFKTADVILFYSNNPGWRPDRAGQLDGFLQRGGGLALFHWAVNGGQYPEELSQRIGLSSIANTSYRHGPVDLHLRPHALTEGFPARLNLIDETYWKLVGNPDRCDVLAQATEEGSPQPQMWTRQVGRGRVFVSIPGHYSWTFDDPAFRVLALRGIAWAAGESVDRLTELATVGARLAE